MKFVVRGIPGMLENVPKIKTELMTRQQVEVIMAQNEQAVLPVSGDCLEGAKVMDGGWVCVDFTRRPAPPRHKSKGGDGSSDFCLCYAALMGQGRPAVMLKKYIGFWGSMCMVSTAYDRWKGGEFHMDYALEALEIFGVVIASWAPDGKLLWQRDPESFPEELDAAPAISGGNVGAPFRLGKEDAERLAQIRKEALA